MSDGVFGESEEGGDFGGAEAFDEDEPEESLAGEVEAVELVADGEKEFGGD